MPILRTLNIFNDIHYFSFENHERLAVKGLNRYVKFMLETMSAYINPSNAEATFVQSFLKTI